MNASVQDIFTTAQQIEEVVSRIYDTLAEQQAGNPEARRLFSGLAEEERQHAARVGMLRSMYLKDGKSFRNLAPVPDGLVPLLNEAQAYLAAIEASSVSLEEARAFAGELEAKMARVHAQALAEGAEPSIKALFEMLAEQDKTHAALLGTAKKSSKKPLGRRTK